MLLCFMFLVSFAIPINANNTSNEVETNIILDVDDICILGADFVPTIKLSKGGEYLLFKNASGESYIGTGKSSNTGNNCPSPPGLSVQEWSSNIDKVLTVLEGKDAIATIVDGTDYWNFVRTGKSTP